MHVAFKTLLIAATMASSALAVPARADEASDKAALARQAVDLAVVPGLDGRIQRMIGQVVDAQPADKQAETRAELMKAAAGVRGDLLSVFASYYAGALSSDELKSIVAFYSSPAGRKLVSVEENKPAEVNTAIQQQIMKLVVMLNAVGGQAR